MTFTVVLRRDATFATSQLMKFCETAEGVDHTEQDQRVLKRVA